MFERRFPASSAAWLRALGDPQTPMPDEDGMVWSSVAGDRLMPVRRAPRREGPPAARPMPRRLVQAEGGPDLR
jgi:hypothetical protein